MVTIDKTGEKKLSEIRVEENKVLAAAEKEHRMEIARLAKLQEAAKEEQNKPLNEIKMWSLVNAEALKEFIKYGSNKVMDQIRVRSHANLMARKEIEALKKKKEGLDPKTVAFTIMVIAVVGVICYIVLSSFLNYSTLEKANSEIKIQAGELAGELANCKIQLRRYLPEADVTISGISTPQPAPASGPTDQTMTG